MTSIITVLTRNLSTTAIRNGKKNPRKWLLYNKAGHRIFKENQRHNPHPDIPIHRRGTRPTGIKIGDEFVNIPEMIPELIVPNLKGCDLKPYVSYRSVDVKQSEFTSRDLFNAIYLNKIRDDWRNGKLDENGNSIQPNDNELLTPKVAKNRAATTGCDLFTADIDCISK